MKAMILAAGFGTRLKPYSLLRPKPLFPVLDEPLVRRTIRQLRACGFTEIIVNAHHLRRQFVELLSAEKDIRLQLEDEILGTGGGLRRALDNLDQQPLLVVNGDICHDIDLGAVYLGHLDSGAAATLVLHDCPRFNKVSVQGERICAFGEKGGGQLAFTGIHVLDSALLTIIPPDSFYNIMDCYRHWLSKGAFIRGHVISDWWIDMGTPADYLALHETLLRRKESPFFLGSRVEVGRDVEFDRWVCIGSGARIASGARLSGVLVWDGARVAADADLVDTIVT